MKLQKLSWFSLVGSVLLVLLFNSILAAGELEPTLASKVQAAAPGEKIAVWIKLPVVESGRNFKSRIASAAATRAERYYLAVNDLQNRHGAAQKNLLEELKDLQNSGEVSEIRPHWITNLVEAQISSEVLSSLAARPDIEKIYAVPKIELIEPLVSNRLPSFSSGIGLNLQLIKAQQAWNAGYTGAGRIVCSFDTGVEGIHPGLFGSWKGHDGDSAAAWFDPGDHETFPHIPSGTNQLHGTHTMGIMVGRDHALSDTLGVAPGAKWISAAVIDVGTSIIDGFEWAANPDGDKNTVDDLPDVINHSWGVPGIGCDPVFYDMIDATEALGIVNIFAAGNEGSVTQTIRNPANRANDSIDCFAVGNVNNSGEVAISSSRGPSDCNGDIKPNVCAPGVTIRSTLPGQTYGNLSGTSMAAPHVSGLVALLRQKNPNATVDEIKTAILTSAVLPPSVPSPNNDYGWGIIDCMAALTALSGTSGPNVRVAGLDHPPISAGDTVSVTVLLENIGRDALDISGSITGTHPSLTLIAPTVFYYGNILQGDTVSSGNTFRVAIADTVTEGSTLSIGFTITGTAYTNVTQIHFQVGPPTERAFVTHNTGRLQFSIGNFGTMGFDDNSFFPSEGAGFIFDTLVNQLFEGGLIVGRSGPQVSDGVRNVLGEPDGDFAVISGGSFQLVSPGPIAFQESMSKFADWRAESPMGLELAQRTFSFNTSGSDKFVILQYEIRNLNGFLLDNLYFGVYFDWDAGPSYLRNAGAYDSTTDILWSAYKSFSGPPLTHYRGVTMLQGTTSTAFTAIETLVGYGPGYDGFTELEKLQALSDGFTTAQTYKTASQNLVQLLAAGPLTLSAGAVDTVTFAVIAGKNFAEIRDAAIAARAEYGCRMGFWDGTDSDGDGSVDPCDNCPDIANAGQTDTDNDRIGDSCDACPTDSLNDADADGYCGDVDNCPDLYNPLQIDSDNDSIGNDCDNCPFVYNPTQADSIGNGKGDACDTTSVSVGVYARPDLPHEYKLAQNHPNPFNPVTRIDFDLPRRSRVVIDVFNLLGQKVVRLHEAEMPAGSYYVEWDGTDTRGYSVASGIYLYLIEADGFRASRKMVLLK